MNLDTAGVSMIQCTSKLVKTEVECKPAVDKYGLQLKQGLIQPAAVQT